MGIDSPSQTALNERRRLAVKLRLEGRKLKEVSDLVDLSAPTIIAAHKQFLAGGWPAVDVKPRGRPSGEKQFSSAKLEALQKLACEIPDGAPLWTSQHLAEAAKSLDMSLTPRTATTYLGQWQLDADNLYLQSKSTNTPWMKETYPELVANARKQKVPVYWAGAASHLKTGQSTSTLNTHYFAHNTKGKYCWLAGKHPSDAAHFKAFFTRLLEQAGGKAIVIWQGYNPQQDPALNNWLEQQTGLQLHMPIADMAGASSNSVRTAQPNNQNLNANDTGNRITTYQRKTNPMTLTHLQRLEAESIHIMREMIANAEKPVMLYSLGKDSSVLLHLALKAFYPAKPPFPLLHIDTGWKFQAMYEFRDKIAKETGMELLTHTNPEGVEKGVNPFTHGSALHTDIMKTAALKQALDKYKFDMAFGGARRDEEKSRAKERVCSFRTDQHRWDPKNQRPELWNLYNLRKNPGESFRAFPLSNWTELDVWQYIHKEDIPVVPLYFSGQRPVVMRNGMLIMVDDDRMPMNEGEVPMMKNVRFRTLGCYPLTGAVESNASTVPEVLEEMLMSNVSERQGRMIDHDSTASMEKKKQEGYF